MWLVARRGRGGRDSKEQASELGTVCEFGRAPARDREEQRLAGGKGLFLRHTSPLDTRLWLILPSICRDTDCLQSSHVLLPMYF